VAQISATVAINAVPAKVWAVLCDLGRYPQWHPYIRRATGEIKAGSQVVFTEALKRGRTSTYLLPSLLRPASP
jgi:uncharacterized protein YndB with AHSA1/START domain